jgi:peptidoglycan/LPS O-acetylase OafA/YrhL
LSVIDTSMLVRAIAIFVVVAGHFGLIAYSGGATSALFLVSGVLLGGLQLPAAAARQSARPVFDLARRLVLPVLAFSLLMLAARLVAGKPWHWGLLTMTTNLLDYAAIPNRQHAEYHFYLWYIHCTLQLLLLTGFAIAIAGRFSQWRFDSFRLSLGLFGVAALLRFPITALFVPDYLAVSQAELTMVHYLPTTHWATLLLGMVIATADTHQRKLITVLVVIGYAGLTALVFSSVAWAFLGGFGLLLLASQRLLIPRPLAWLAFTLSGASLFIYLTHFHWAALLRKLGMAGSPLLSVLVALVGGVIIWAVWQRFVPGKLGKDTASAV